MGLRNKGAASITMHHTLTIKNPRYSSSQLALLFSLLAGALFLIRYGYGYGFSDQDELLPLITHWLNPELLANDWFVSLQTRGFGIRTFLARVIWLPALVVDLKHVVFAFHVVVLIGLGIAVYRIAWSLYARQLSAGLAVILVMTVTTRFNPGGNDIIHAMLVSSSVSWCLGLWSLERLMNAKMLASGILISFALLSHPLVGLQIGAILAVVVLLDKQVNRAGFLLPMAFTAIPLVILFANLGTPSISDPSFSISENVLDPTFIMTHLRVPHHYLPSAFSSASWLKLSALALLTLGFWIASKAPLFELLKGRQELRTRPEVLIVRIIVLLIAVLAVAFLFTDVWEIPNVVRLQPFNLSVFLRVATSIVLAQALCELMPREMYSYIERTLHKGWLFVSVVFLFGAIAIYVNIGPNARLADRTDLEAFFDTAESESHPDAVFAIPPSMSGFQVGANRAQFVSFKSFPFSSQPTLEWLRRLRLTAPVENLEPGGVPLLERFDAAYAAQDPDYWKEILQREHIDFVVRQRQDGDEWTEHIEPAWCSNNWCVYWAGRILTPR